jgi:hypothetical protein
MVVPAAILYSEKYNIHSMRNYAHKIAEICVFPKMCYKCFSEKNLVAHQLGKLHIWNTGLTKGTNSIVADYGKKQSITKSLHSMKLYKKEVDKIGFDGNTWRN